MVDSLRGSSFCLIQAAMQPLVSLAVKRSLLPPKKDQILRRSHSDAAAEAGDNRDFETRGAECECCGMKEEYTPAYIAGVQQLFCGSWVCGLCAEAVKESMKRQPDPSPASAGLRRALDSHMEFRKKFNGTTRLNPKLSFAGTMREIARKSLLRRSSGGGGGGGIARTWSCGQFMDVKFDSNG